MTPKNRYRSLIVSIALHGALLAAIGTATYKIAVPEGEVGSTLDIVPPKGEDIPVEVIQAPIQVPDEKPGIVQAKVKEKPKPPKKKKAKPKKKPKPKPQPPVQAETSEVETPVAETEEENYEEVLPEEQTGAENEENEEVEPVKEPEETELPLPTAKEDVTGEENIERDTGLPAPLPERRGFHEGVPLADKELQGLPGNRPPNYPVLARFRRIQGVVILDFQVLANGTVGKVWVVKSSGYRILDQEAAEAQLKYKYQPGKVGIFRKAHVFRLVGEAKEMPTR